MKIIVISIFGNSPTGRASKIINNVFPDDEVILITSDFDHGKKTYIDSDGSIMNNVIAIHVPSYKKNLSLKRLYSHIYFAYKLRKILNNVSEGTDLVYCAMPTSTATVVAGKYCKQHGIPFMIDIIDLWPDSLIPIMPFKPLKWIINLVTYPWKFLTHKAYRIADYISAESNKYADVGHRVNPNVPYSSTYLGIDVEKTTRLINESKVSLDKVKDEIWIAYGGSLGQSYDFDVILNGLIYLESQGIRYKMWMIGDGEKREYIEKLVLENNLNVEITGRLAYKDFLRYLSYCDIAINSFKEGTLVVHSYKFNDYVATGCYVMNNLPGETAEMISKYGIGDNFTKDDFNEKLLKTINNWGVIKKRLSDSLQSLQNDLLSTHSIYKQLRYRIETELLK